MRSILVACALIALSCMFEHEIRAEQISQTDFVQYRDERYRFSIHYPRSWSKVEATHAQTRLKAVSDGGSGGDDLSVVVTTVPGSENETPEEFLKSIDAKAYLNYLRENVPGAKLIEHGPTSLSNQAAYYFITDLTHRVLGMEVLMRQLQFQTVRKGNVYTITFRTDPEHFPGRSTLFKLITVGFVFWPDGPDASR
jgi:PsbP